MINERLEAIRERLEEATDGPWRHKRHRSGAAVGVKTSHAFVSDDKPNRSYSDRPGIVFRFEQSHRNPEYDPLAPADANLIAHAPTDLRYLLDRIEAQAEVVGAAREAIRPHGRADFEFEANERLREALDNLEEQTDD